jgi:hypothetical protein
MEKCRCLNPEYFDFHTDIEGGTSFSHSITCKNCNGTVLCSRESFISYEKEECRRCKRKTAEILQLEDIIEELHEGL